MRTADECLIKAAELEKRAAECPEGDARASFQSMASHWRSFAADSDCAAMLAAAEPRSFLP